MKIATVTVWHNEELDDEGRHPAWNRGYRPGDKMVSVTSGLQLVVPASANAVQIAEGVFMGASREMCVIPEWTKPVGYLYHWHEIRSLSMGDVVMVDGEAYAVDRAGWSPVQAPTSAAALTD